MHALIIQRCDFQLISEEQIMVETKGMTMKTKNGILARVNQRDS